MNTSEMLLSKLFPPAEQVNFGPIDVFVAMIVSTLLCFMLARVYRTTHRGTSYSQSFLVTMLFMGVTTSVVMLIIGSNVARAFSLVGALSVIRFRTAMKDPRDTGFLFAAMVIGMGCGTGFYMPAIALTMFVSVLGLALYHFDFGVKQQLESVLHVTLNPSGMSQERVEAELNQTCERVRQINRIMDFGDQQITNVYIVRPKSKNSFSEVESRLQKVEGVSRLSRYDSDQHTTA